MEIPDTFPVRVVKRKTRAVIEGHGLSVHRRENNERIKAGLLTSG